MLKKQEHLMKFRTKLNLLRWLSLATAATIAIYAFGSPNGFFLMAVIAFNDIWSDLTDWLILEKNNAKT